MKITNIAVLAWLLLVTLVACDKDNNGINPENPDNTTIVEIKEESLCGTWTLSREDNGIKITTSFEIKEDNTCVYTQTITDRFNYESMDVNNVAFNGKWSYEEKGGRLTFNLSDDNGEDSVAIDCIVTKSGEIAIAFKIWDAFSEDDDYRFIKK